MKHIVLIDGHHMMYRAYWAIPRTLKTRAGEQVNTTFGMASMLLNIVTTEEPDAIIICFDEGSETFRHQELDTYKDGRAETPDDFYIQIPRVMELLARMQFTTISDPKFEADDLLASYAVAAVNNGMRATIVSGDKDLFQMASESIRIAIPHKGYQAVEYLDASGVQQKLGVRPDQVASYKGLCGDSSDNLPGVMGIGPKTAVKLLQNYQTLDGVYEHIEEIKGSTKDKLLADKQKAFFCERMATLIQDVPLPLLLEETEIFNIPADSIFEFFTELEFTMLTRRLQSLLDTNYGIDHFDINHEAIFAKSQKKSEEDQMTLF